MNVKYTLPKVSAETGLIVVVVVVARVSSRKDIEWRRRNPTTPRTRRAFNSPADEKGESIYQEGFSQRRRNAYDGVGAEYVAFSTHDEFQLSGRTDPRTKTALYGFYNELKEYFAV